MKLYDSPAYCSQAVHIALRENGIASDCCVKVDTVAARTAQGADFREINSRGYVSWAPMLGMSLAAFPNLRAWMTRVRARAQVQAALRGEGLLQD